MYKDKISKAVKRLWIGRCTIINYTDNTDDNGITKTCKTVIAENIPCRLSYKNNQQGNQTNTTDNISQEIKLFIDNDIEVKPGSDITVTQNGVTRDYKSSGIPSVYSVHQEISLICEDVHA